MSNAKVCLSMIVKNESAVIERCLSSIKPLIHSWIVVDTGSTDATQAIVKNTLRDLPGKVIQEPWKDFAYNRTIGLQQAAQMGCDYTFVIDADEVMRYEPGFQWPVLDKDMYFISCEYGDTKYDRAQLLRSRLPWKYVGVVHEYATCGPIELSVGHISGINCIPYPDGHRSQDPMKYQRDAIRLMEALLTEPENSRYVFYLAQSFRDYGDYDNAIKYYEQRAKMGGWHEEVWYSLYEVACLRAMKQDPWESVVQSFLRAYEYYPKRAEPIYHLCRDARLRGNPRTACMWAEVALSIPMPNDQLFLDWSIYDHKIIDEYAVSLYNIGNYKKSLMLCNHLLEKTRLPDSERERVEKNKNFALEKLTTKG